jgi:NADH-quinone oxidoreductase subunit N
MNNLAYSLFAAMPELILMMIGFLSLLSGVFFDQRKSRHAGLLAIVAFAVAAYAVINPWREAHLLNDGLPVFAFNKMFVDDGFGRFIKLILLASSALSIMLSWTYFEKEGDARPEYPTLIIFATLGMMLMVSASNLMSLYVGLELQSLSLYVLAAFRRDDARSSEAGLKYFVLGALASGLLLYGISLIYGFAGTTDFVDLAFAFKSAPPATGVVVGMVFIAAALAFKVSAVPFHMWTPDVYEGAPTPVTAFFSAAPKVAGVALFVRLLLQPMSGLAHQWHQIIVFIALASMLLGSFAGLAQSSIKRLMAYSSIANVGYVLVGLAVGGKPGMQAILIYLVIYFLNTLGAFGVILCLSRQGKAVDKITDLSGLAKTQPLLALAMVILMFSMAGVPPLAGFFGKYFVFLAAVRAHMVPLAVVGVLTSVVAAYYYLRIVKVMYFDDTGEPLDALPDWGVKTVVALSALYMIGFTLMPSPLIDRALAATYSFLG